MPTRTPRYHGAALPWFVLVIALVALLIYLFHPVISRHAAEFLLSRYELPLKFRQSELDLRRGAVVLRDVSSSSFDFNAAAVSLSVSQVALLRGRLNTSHVSLSNATVDGVALRAWLKTRAAASDHMVVDVLDLKDVRLTFADGMPFVIGNATLKGLARLNDADARVSMRMHVAAADVTVQGSLASTPDGYTFSGKFTASEATSLKGSAAVGNFSADTLSGSADVTAHYNTGNAVVELQASCDVVGDAVRYTPVGARWDELALNGVLRALWSTATADEPQLTFTGVMAGGVLSFAPPGKRSAWTLSEPRFDGTFSVAGGIQTSGHLTAAGMHWKREPLRSAAGSLAELSGEQLRAQVRGYARQNGGGFWLDRARFDSLILRAPNDGPWTRLDEVRFGDFHIAHDGRVALGSLGATTGSAGSDADRTVWRFADSNVEGAVLFPEIASHNDGAAKVFAAALINAASVNQVDEGGRALHVSTATLRDTAFAADGTLRVDEITLPTLHLKTDAYTSRARDIRIVDFASAANSQTMATLEVQSFAHDVGEQFDYLFTDATASDVRVAGTDYYAAQASVEEMRGDAKDVGRMDARQLTAQALQIEPAAARSAVLNAGSLRLMSPLQGTLSLAEVAARDLESRMTGDWEVASIAAANAQFNASSSGEGQAASIALENLSGQGVSTLAGQRLRATSASYQAFAGHTVELGRLISREFALAPVGFNVAWIELEDARVASAAQSAWQASAVDLRALEWSRAEDTWTLRKLRSEGLQHDGAARVRAEGVEANALRLDDDVAQVAEFSAVALKSEVFGGVRTGRVKASVFAYARVDDLVSLESWQVRALEHTLPGEAAGSSFAELEVLGSVLRDGLLDLGRVSIRGLALVFARRTTDVTRAPARLPREWLPPRGVTLDTFAVVDSRSRVMFIDETIAPPFRITLEPLRATVARDEAKNGSLYLQARGPLSGGGDVSLEGTYALADESLRNMQMAVQVRGFGLSQAAPYAKSAFALDVQSGTLVADADVSVRDANLSVQMTVELGDLRSVLTSGSKGTLTRVRHLALDEALAMLVNADGEIRLKVAFEDVLYNPAFNPAKRLVWGLRVALESALDRTLERAGMTGGSGRVRFMPGQAVLDDVAIAALEQIAVLLKARPRLDVRVCGEASAIDRDAAIATPADLRGLAVARENRVRGFLLAQHMLSPDRLRACSFGSPDGTGLPGVELFLLPRVVSD